MTKVAVDATSLRQVDRIKATVVGKSYPLTLVKDYVSKWGMAEAVRELIQNALDSTSPFIYSWTVEDDAWTLMLNSSLTVLTPQTLLMGATSKSEDANAIGSFGEGYKLALLVLTRLGISVQMLNGDVLWRPVFRYNRNFDAELLTIDESFLQEKGNQGLTFYIEGLSTADKEAVEESCLRMQQDIGAIKQTVYGDILLDRKGLLYVGGLFICTTELTYSYNIKPMYLTLERDRRTVSDWDLESLTTKMWFEAVEPTEVAKMIKAEIPDVRHAKYNAPEIIREECYKLFREVHPEALFADSLEEARDSIKKGLVKTVYGGGGSFYSTVSSSRSYSRDVDIYRAAPPESTKSSPYQTLDDFKQAYWHSMSADCQKALNIILTRARKWKDGDE